MPSGLTVISLTAAALEAAVGLTYLPAAFLSAAAGMRNRAASALSMTDHRLRFPVIWGGSESKFPVVGSLTSCVPGCWLSAMSLASSVSGYTGASWLDTGMYGSIGRKPLIGYLSPR